MLREILFFLELANVGAKWYASLPLMIAVKRGDKIVEIPRACYVYEILFTLYKGGTNMSDLYRMLDVRDSRVRESGVL